MTKNVTQLTLQPQLLLQLLNGFILRLYIPKIFCEIILNIDMAQKQPCIKQDTDTNPKKQKAKQRKICLRICHFCLSVGIIFIPSK